MSASDVQSGTEDGLKCTTSSLPTDNSVYNKKEYWDTRYAEEREFDWLGDFSGFRDLFLKHVPLSSHREAKLLILGCGNSALGRQLCDEGYTNVTNSDYSEVCIANQEKWNREEGYTNLKWKVIDMTDMSSIKDGEYDIVVEKATIDAFYVEEASSWRTSPETSIKVDQCLREISRVLCTSGKFISLSFTPGRFRLPVLARPEFDWDVTPETFDNGGLPYTFYCLTKGQTLSREVVTRVESFQLKPATEVSETLSESEEEDFELASKMLSNISISSSSDESPDS